MWKCDTTWNCDMAWDMWKMRSNLVRQEGGVGRGKRGEKRLKCALGPHIECTSTLCYRI